MPAVRRAAALSLLVLAVLPALAACSDDGTKALPPDSSGLPVGATTTIEPSFTGAGSERFCGQARTARERLGRLITVPPSPDAVRDLFTSAVDAVRGMADSAPGEIAGDVRLLLDAYDTMVDGLRQSAWDPSRLATEFTDKFREPAVRLASDRLKTYERTVCGIAD